MSLNPLWQCGQDRLAVGGNPPFAAVTGGAHRNRQVLNQKGLITFEA